MYWHKLGGNLSSGPSVSSWSSGRLDVFARGEDQSLIHKWYDGGWSDWESLGGILAHTSGLGVSSWGHGRLDVFIRGGDDRLYHKWHDNGWSDWESLGGILTADPAAVSDKNGRIHIFSRSTNYQLKHIWFEDSWRHWESLGGYFTPGPTVCSWDQDRLDVFVRGSDGQMHQKWFDGGWSNWASFGGEIASASAAASWGPNRIDVFAQETDNQLIQKWYNVAWYPPENTEKSEKVRVTINGFIVRSQTVDHAFNVDGWGDEVYLSTISTVLNSNGEERFYPVERTSAVIGDAEGFSLQDRVKAGTASPWRTGGLKSGDAVPTSTPYNRTGPIQARMVPMTVFEEKLGSGDILTVIPTIWEWDNGTSDAYTEVVNLLKNNMDKIGGAVTVIAGPGSTPYILIGKTIVDLSSALKPIVGNAADRPIGSNPKGEFAPKAIGLNLDKAKTMAETDNGLGKGIFEVNYQDKGGLSENYTLHLQVEMI